MFKNWGIKRRHRINSSNKRVNQIKELSKLSCLVSHYDSQSEKNYLSGTVLITKNGFMPYWIHEFCIEHCRYEDGSVLYKILDSSICASIHGVPGGLNYTVYSNYKIFNAEESVFPIEDVFEYAEINYGKGEEFLTLLSSLRGDKTISTGMLEICNTPLAMKILKII